MRWLTTLMLGVGLLGLPVPVWAQAQLTASHQTNVNTPNHIEVQVLRCDNSDTINTGRPDSPINGETCATGDWTKPVDCRGADTAQITYYEYGAGSGDMKLWSCNESVGFGPVASEDPSAAPSAADPDPLCFEITNGITLDGTTTNVVSASEDTVVFAWLVVEVDDCTGDCDGTVTVSCRR